MNLSEKKIALKTLWKTLENYKKHNLSTAKIREKIYNLQDEIAIDTVRTGQYIKINYGLGRIKSKNVLDIIEEET